MIDGNAINDFASAVRDADDAFSAWQAYMGKLEELGIHHAKYGFTCVNPMTPRDMTLFTLGEMCPEWEDTHDAERWYRDDAIVEHCLSSADPITFSDLYKKLDDGALTRAQVQNHSIGREAGMSQGFAFGFHGGLPLTFGGVSIDASRNLSAKEFNGLMSQHYAYIHQITEVFHSNLNKGSLLNEGDIPSSRERECLLWAAQGLRVDQIAFRTGTHSKTVEKQLGNVRRKLHAKTNAQAVLRAIVFGFLEV